MTSTPSRRSLLRGAAFSTVAATIPTTVATAIGAEDDRLPAMVAAFLPQYREAARLNQTTKEKIGQMKGAGFFQFPTWRIQDSDMLIIRDADTLAFDPSPIVAHFQAKLDADPSLFQPAFIAHRDRHVELARKHFDAWTRADGEIGLTETWEKSEAAWDRNEAAVEAIIGTPPRSLAGALAKLRFALVTAWDYSYDDTLEDQDMGIRALAEAIDFIDRLGEAVASRSRRFPASS